MLVRSIFAQYINKFISLPLSIVAHALIIDKLGISDMAYYSILLSVVTYLIGFTDFGVGNYLFQRMVQGKLDFFRLMIKIRMLILGFCIALLGLLLGIKVLDIQMDIYGGLILLFLVIIQILSDVSDKVIRSLSRFDLIARRNVIYSILFFVLICGGAYFDSLNVYVVLIFSLVAFFVRLVIGLKDYHKNKSHFEDEVLSLEKLSLKALSPFSVVFISGLVFTRLDLFMLSYFSSKYDVAIYGAVYGFYEKLEFFVLAITNVLFVYFGEKDSEGKFKYILNLLIIIGGCFVIFGGVISDLFLKYLINVEKYPEASDLFRIMLTGTYFKFLASFLNGLLILKNYQSKYAYANVLYLTFNFVTNLAVIPFYGAIGATYTTFLSDFFLCCVITYHFVNNIGNKIPLSYYVLAIVLVSTIWLNIYYQLTIMLVSLVFFVRYSIVPDWDQIKQILNEKK